jgi:Zn-finger nucleic acid-binding protein
MRLGLLWQNAAVLLKSAAANKTAFVTGGSFMKCPACETSLTSVQAGTVTVDVCLGGCGGIWFDHFELQKLDEPNELAGQMLVNLKKRPDLEVDLSRRRHCPRCSIVMMRHFFSPQRRVEVDECPSCGGFWLDAGELALIREEHQSERERQMAVEEYLTRMSEKSLASMRAGGVEEVARAKRINQLLRFSSPIRYQHD